MLMARYQQGELAAARDLIDRASPRLLRFFSVQSASRSHADDLLQDTWLRVHGVRHTYRPGEPLLPWLYGIARHVRVDHYRRTRRRAAREVVVEDLGRLPVAAPTAPAMPLEAMLAPLSASQREVIELLKVTGMSLEDVARATASTVGAVKQKAHRAYEKLRRTLRAAAATGGRES